MESSSRRGPATFQYLSLLYSFFIHSTQTLTRMFHQELPQLLQKRRSQPTHLRLIFLTVLLSIFHLNTSRQNTKQSLRLSPCVTDWRQRVARWSIYFQLTRASTIQHSWHKWYWRKHCTFTEQLAQVVLPTGGAYLRHHASQTFPGGERLSS